MRHRFGMLLLAGLILLSACTALPKGQTLEGAGRDQALAYIDPMAESMLQGLKNGDYAVFSHDFNNEMLEALGPAKFDELRQQLNQRIGAYQSREVQKVVDYGAVITATYKGVFEKAKAVNILVTVTKDEPHRVAGLYFQ